MQTYKQNIKNDARERLAKHAIHTLTTERINSFLVSKAHFTKITDHFNAMLFKFLGSNSFEFINKYNWSFFGGKNSWFEFYDSICKPLASELKVLYFSGPEYEIRIRKYNHNENTLHVDINGYNVLFNL